MPEEVRTNEESAMVRRWVSRLTGSGSTAPPLRIECRRQGWGTMKIGRSCIGTPLCLGGRTCVHGLGTHASSEIVASYPEPMRRVRAVVGMDQNSATKNYAGRGVSLVFSVRVGERTLWRSGALSIDSAPQPVDLELPGVMAMTLCVDAEGGDIHLAHADWADLRVLVGDGNWVLAGMLDGAVDLDLGAPISFWLDGKKSDGLLPFWHRTCQSTEKENGVCLHQVAMRDAATGVECRLEVREFAGFPAVEWTPYFHNAGPHDSPILEGMQSLDVRWLFRGEAAVLHRSHGSRNAVDDFLYCRDALMPGSHIRVAPGGGRSSNQWLPFFNLETNATGLILGIGWTGEWAAEFRRDFTDTVNIQAGMNHTHLRLRPGESIRLPSILLLFWQGTPIHGTNLLRRFILRHHTPQVGNQPLRAPISCITWGGMKTESHLAQIAIIREQKLPYDYYWVDAGWYGPADSISQNEFGEEWAKHCGDWNVNPAAHPQGLKVLSDAARAAGMKFLLWLEPERAVCGTPITQEHPEWFLGDAAKPGGNLLFNLGLPAARRWLTDFISRLLQEHGVDGYRQDFNIEPLRYWQTADEPDRQGVTEIRYIEGLYAFWDELRFRHPDLLIDNCASGGRRIDVETISRSIPLWRSDLQCHPTFNPVGGQVQTHGLAHWVPLSGDGTQCRPGDTYSFRSVLSAALAFFLFAYEHDLAKTSPGYPYEWHRRMMDQHRRARPLFYGDYYPLTGRDAAPDGWMAYQFHRPDLEEGMVLAFRRDNSPFSQASFKLCGLTPACRYLLEDADVGEPTSISGEMLTECGILILLGKPRESRLMFYRKK